MKTNRIRLFLCLAALLVVPTLTGEELKLWGKQTAGWGHSKNAETEGNRLVLQKPATIIKVTGSADKYCIWAAVTPQNPSARSILCGGKGKDSLVGSTLPAGTYTVLPSVEGKRSADVVILLE